MIDNKKGDISLPVGTIVKIILWLVVLILAIGFLSNIFISKTSAIAGESTCRLSVAMREKYRADLLLGKVAPPLLCKTFDLKIPESGKESKEKIMKDISEKIARCWWMFGEGLVKDPFLETISDLGRSCFVCYTISTEKMSENQIITSEDLLNYMSQTPYLVKGFGDFCYNEGGYCISDGESCHSEFKEDSGNKICKEKGKDICCYSRVSTCINKGGVCSTEPPDKNYLLYEDPYWQCSSRDNKCYLERGKVMTYRDYIYLYGGAGYFYINTPIKKGQIYAITFGAADSKTREFFKNLEPFSTVYENNYIFFTELIQATSSPLWCDINK